MNTLKQNLTKILEKQNISCGKLEKRSGLSRNFISNILRDTKRSPNIDSIIKLATTLNMSLDELVGLPTKNIAYDVKIDNLPLFLEVSTFILDKLKNHSQVISSSNIFKITLDVYSYSKAQNKMDKKYATYCVETKLLKENK